MDSVAQRAPTRCRCEKWASCSCPRRAKDFHAARLRPVHYITSRGLHHTAPQTYISVFFNKLCLENRSYAYATIQPPWAYLRAWKNSTLFRQVPSVVRDRVLLQNLCYNGKKNGHLRSNSIELHSSILTIEMWSQQSRYRCKTNENQGYSISNLISTGSGLSGRWDPFFESLDYPILTTAN